MFINLADFDFSMLDYVSSPIGSHLYFVRMHHTTEFVCIFNKKCRVPALSFGLRRPVIQKKKMPTVNSSASCVAILAGRVLGVNSSNQCAGQVLPLNITQLWG